MNDQQATKPKPSRGRPPRQAPKKPATSKNDNISGSKHQLMEWVVANKNEVDPCDCLYDDCPGCWYPCEKCGSNKCSPFCRRSRREAQWQQQHIEWKPTR